MKPIFARIPEITDNDVFAYRETTLPYFSTEFHFHKECQMVYILESEGKRVIGDNIETFSKDELIFLGPDIPHVWHNERFYFENDNPETRAHSIALFFDPAKLVDMLTKFGSIKEVEAFLLLSRRGVKFTGTTKDELKDMMLDIPNHDGIGRLDLLLKMLRIMSKSKEITPLATEGYINTYHHRDNERIDRVFKFIFGNFHKDIQLDEVAKVANMNKQAFCRYFKMRTQKTFIEFVNQIRINHACKMIETRNVAISTLAYECGFNSLSNFNRFFKEVKGITPREFKKRITVKA